MTATFRVLGAVEVIIAGQPVPLSGKPLTLLACLLVRANAAVSVDALADALWGEAGAHTKGAVQTYVMRLRRSLGADIVRTTESGYRIDVGADDLDLLRFTALVERGDAAMAGGETATAATHYADALALWRGPALANVVSDALQREDASALTEQRLGVWERWIDAQLRLGAMPIAELKRLTGENPLHEPFWEQLMLALHRAGRTADALAAYRQVSDTLAEDLGLDPGSSLQRMQQAVLTGDPSLDGPGAQAPQPAPERAVPVPQQLSAAIDGFTGRGDELAQLAKIVSRGTGTSAVIAAIEGTGGVGKTALAVRFAHGVADQFPDGRIQLNLHGYGPGDPVPPSVALESLLQSVGVPGGEIPASLDDRAALWRTHTSGRKILILLDNARSTDQVRPLLPGPGCFVLVTTRGALRGLTVRDGAGRVSLERLSDADALDLLSKTVGAERVAADQAASRRFIAHCAQLPLAIRILGEYADQQPDRPLAEIVEEIDGGSDRLAYFDLDDGEDTNLRVIFDRSYAALDDDAARVFRLLGLHPGRAFGVPVVAALADRPVAGTRRLLERLVRAHLLEQHRPGRYEFHDLLREFAVTLARQDDEAARVAVERVLDWYLHAALCACEVLRPGWADGIAPAAGLQLPAIMGRPDAMDWYGDERDNLLAAVETARAQQLHWHVCHLVMALRPYFTDVPLRDGWIATHEVALESARAIEDRRLEGQLMCGLGVAHTRFGTTELAPAYCQSALDIARELGLYDDEYSALINLGAALAHLSDHYQAIDLTTQALAVAQKLDRRRELLARNNLAECYVRVGQFDDAVAQARVVLDLIVDSSDPHGKALALLNLASAQAGLRDYDASSSNYRAALALFREVGGVLGQAEVLEELGNLNAEVGDTDAAIRHYQDALDQLVTLGHRNAERVRSKLAELGSATR